MKTMKKILALSMMIICIFTMISCKDKNISWTEQVKATSFLNTEWGMSKEQTLEALGLTEDDIESYDYSNGYISDEEEIGRTYIVKNKMIVDNLECTVLLNFVYNLGDVYDLKSFEYRTIDLGLTSVKVLFDENDYYNVYDSFKDELGVSTREILKAYDGDGYMSNEIQLFNLRNQDIKREYMAMLEDTTNYSKDEDHLDDVLFSFSIVRATDENELPLGSRQMVEYNGLGLAVLNNLNK